MSKESWATRYHFVEPRALYPLRDEAARALKADPALAERWLKRACDMTKPDLIGDRDWNWPCAFAAWVMSGERL